MSISLRPTSTRRGRVRSPHRPGPAGGDGATACPSNCATSPRWASWPLDGKRRPVKGARRWRWPPPAAGYPKLLVPVANAREAAVVEAVAVFGVASLAEAVGIISGQLPAETGRVAHRRVVRRLNTYDVDFSDVRGQEFAKRTLWSRQRPAA